jgi:hypothetical protein
MFPQFQMISDFDEYEKFEDQPTRFSALVFHKEDLFK